MRFTPTIAFYSNASDRPIVIVGDWGLCCRLQVTSLQRLLTPFVCCLYDVLWLPERRVQHIVLTDEEDGDSPVQFSAAKNLHALAWVGVLSLIHI